MKPIKTISVVAPAKVNLFLAINGVRSDGFHNLVSLVAPLILGDFLTLELCQKEDHIVCGSTEMPLDSDNLVIKAVKAFRECYPFSGGVCFELKKYIPVGAGFGGGSSDAVAALESLNLYFGHPLPKQKLLEIAIMLGSDCPLFLEGRPIIMRGRGEKISFLKKSTELALRRKKILVFKPIFSIDTNSAYNKLKDRGLYLAEETAEIKLEELILAIDRDGQNIAEFSYNSFESLVYGEHPELEILASDLMKKWGAVMHMSGSGSACFCFLQNDQDSVRIKEFTKKALGKDIFLIETFLK